jgi:hypothetical protein
MSFMDSRRKILKAADRTRKSTNFTMTRVEIHGASTPSSPTIDAAAARLRHRFAALVA